MDKMVEDHVVDFEECRVIVACAVSNVAVRFLGKLRAFMLLLHSSSIAYGGVSGFVFVLLHRASCCVESARSYRLRLRLRLRLLSAKEYSVVHV
jgi:hypothetical protein